MAGGYGFGSVCKRGGAEAARRAMRSAGYRAENLRIVRGIVESHGPKVCLWTTSADEYALRGRDGLVVSRNRVHYWSSLGWVKLRHLGGTYYRIEIDEEELR